jgi:predicted small lipoprotein YifL
MMRALLLLAAAAGLASCGQTGALYLPDESVRTPVEIRTPADIEKEKKDEKPAAPPPAA